MPEDLGERPGLKLKRPTEIYRLMLVKLEIEIQGEVLQVRDTASGLKWSSIYPDQIFSTRGVSFAYDELRGMGNGKYQVKLSKLLPKIQESSIVSEVSGD